MLKQWVILGATSDIVKAILKHPKFDVTSLLLVARNPELLNTIAQDCKARKPDVQIQTVTLDFSLTEKANWLATLIQKTFTEPYGIVYGAGILDDDGSPKPEKIVQTLHVNYTFPMLLLEELFQQNQPLCQSVVVIGSVAGDRGRSKNYRYGATKSAIEAYLSGLRQRLYPKPTQILLVKPGFVKTKMIHHLTFTPLATTPERVASDILKAIRKEKFVIYTPWFMKWVMCVIKSIPEALFRKVKV